MLSVCYLVRLDGWFCSHHYCIWLVSSDTQGCLLTSHRDSLCLWSVWRHLLTRLITLSDKFRCSNQVSAPDLILVYVWKGMSPHSMSYNKMPRDHTFKPSAWKLLAEIHSGGAYTLLPRTLCRFLNVGVLLIQNR